MKTILCMFMVVVVSLMVGRNVVAAQDGECEGLEGAAWGLCQSYCEALDCDGDPQASPEACSRVLANFRKITDGQDPPCAVQCPCFTAVEIDDFYGNRGWPHPDRMCVDTGPVGPNGPYALYYTLMFTHDPSPGNSPLIYVRAEDNGFGQQERTCCWSDPEVGFSLSSSGLTEEQYDQCRQEIIDSNLWNTCDQ